MSIVLCFIIVCEGVCALLLKGFKQHVYYNLTLYMYRLSVPWVQLLAQQITPCAYIQHYSHNMHTHIHIKNMYVWYVCTSLVDDPRRLISHILLCSCGLSGLLKWLLDNVTGITAQVGLWISFKRSHRFQVEAGAVYVRWRLNTVCVRVWMLAMHLCNICLCAWPYWPGFMSF